MRNNHHCFRPLDTETAEKFRMFEVNPEALELRIQLEQGLIHTIEFATKILDLAERNGLVVTAV